MPRILRAIAEWLTSTEAADRMGIATKTFGINAKKWADAGLIHREQKEGKGNAYLYADDDALADLIESRKRKRTGQTSALNGTTKSGADDAAEVSPPPPVTPSTEVEEIAAAIEQPEPDAVPNKNMDAGPDEIPVIWAKSLAVTLSASAAGMTFDVTTIAMPSKSVLTLYVEGGEGLDLTVEQATALSLLLGGALRQAESLEQQLHSGGAS